MRTASAIGLVFATASLAHAQNPIGVIGPDLSLCLPLDDSCVGDDDCAEAFPGDVVCAPITNPGGMTTSRCVPIPSAFCCADNIDCPLGYTCGDPVIEGAGLCLGDGDDYCAEAPSHDQIVFCHTSPDGFAPVGWNAGDCDRDGVRNGLERDVATDPCEAPPETVGVWIDTGDTYACVEGVTACDEIDTPCAIGAVEGVCTRNAQTGEGAPLCSIPPHIFCCGGANEIECPSGDCVLPAANPQGLGVCAEETLCSDDRETLMRCHTAPLGAFPVTLDRGDCDLDGVANGEESNTGRDPCVAEETPDGSVARFDAGARVPEELQPRFAGGGGCVCGIAHRPAPHQRGSGAAWLAIAVLVTRASYRARRSLRASRDPESRR